MVAAAALVGLGIANLYLIGARDLAVRQTLIAAGGVLALAVFWRVRARYLNVLAWIAYAGAVLLLVGVLVVGLSANGATRWFAIGPMTFQPSELAKLSLILVLAAVLGSGRPPWQRFALALLLAALPIGLTLLQPDLSTSMLLIVLTAGMLLLGRIPARFLLPLAAAAAVSAPLLISFLRPYQVSRLGSFLVGAHEAPTGSGWAIRQAHIAVGSSGLFGRTDDPLRGLRSQYLPERDTDLALASLVGQWGLVAGAGVVLAALLLVWRLALASRASRTPHGALVGGGLAVLLGVEVVVSVGANLGLLPLAGVPFPLVSYGGTALVVHLAALGVVLGVRRDSARRRLWAAPGRRNPRPRLVRLVAAALSIVLISFGVYGWRMQETRGEALQIAGDDQMTRCFRLPAPRGTITDRHDVPVALDAADAGIGVDRVLVVPALLRARPADVDRLAVLVGRPPADLHAQLAATEGTTLSLPVADVPRPVADAVSAAAIEGVFVVAQPRRAYPQGALLGSGARLRRRGHPRGRAALAGPAGGGVRRPGRARAGVRRGAARDQRAAVPVRRPGRRAGGPGRAAAAGARCRPAAVHRPRSPAPARRRARAPPWEPSRGRRARSARPSRWTRGTARCWRSRARRRSTTTCTARRSTAQRCRALFGLPGSPMLEHVTQAVAPPGSTFKLVTAAANQVHGIYGPNQVIPTGASFTYGGHTFGNWRPMGPMDLVESIAVSNDVYFYKLAVALGADRLIDTARALGRGRADRDRPAGGVRRSPGLAAHRRGGGARLVRRVHGHPRHRPGRPDGHAVAERRVDRRPLDRPAGHAPAGHGPGHRAGHAHPDRRPAAAAAAVHGRSGAGARGDAGGRGGRHREPAERPAGAGRRPRPARPRTAACAPTSTTTGCPPSPPWTPPRS